MKTIHGKLEDAFASFTALVYDRKYIALLLVLLLAGCLVAQMPKLTVDTRDESFFKADDPALVAYNRFRDTFGQDDLFMVAVRSDRGFDLEFFDTLYRLHNELASEVPYLDDITSLINARIVLGRGDTLLVDELMKSPPQTDGELKRIFGLIDQYPLYDKLLISEDRTLTSILIKARALRALGEEALLEGFDTEEEPAGGRYLTNAENIEISRVIGSILKKYEGRGLTFHTAGTPAVVAELTNAIEADMKLTVPASILLIIFFLVILFRRVSGVVFPLLVVFLTLASTLGIMAAAGIPITPVIQILPSFLIVVGIGDSVHIMTLFYRSFRETRDKRAAIIHAASRAGLPVLMTSVTTSCGLLSFTLADVASVAQLGIAGPAGVMLAFVYTAVLLPALTALLPMKQKASPEDRDYSRTDRIFRAIARITAGYPLRVLLVSALIVGAGIWGTFSLKFSHNILTWFPEDSPIRTANELLDAVNGGTVMLEVTFDTGEENGLHDPDLLHRFKEAATDLPGMEAGGIRAAKAWSIADVLKEINRALHGGRKEAYTVPEDRDLIAQELVLFEAGGSDDLEDFSDPRYRTGRLSILAPFTDAVLYRDYIDAVEGYLDREFPDQEVLLTGRMALFMQIMKNVIAGMIKSYAFALVVITVLMTLLIGRLRIGLLSMAANVAPIICIMGFMGVKGIPLDLSTVLVGSIALGLVVDDTIHFLYHFKRAYEETGCVETAVSETLMSTGRALVITSMVLGGGFLIYLFATLQSSVRFGLLIGCSIIFALAADFFLVPALLSLVHGKSEAVETAPAPAGREPLGA